jgi:hypothetical protein
VTEPTLALASREARAKVGDEIDRKVIEDHVCSGRGWKRIQYQGNKQECPAVHTAVEVMTAHVEAVSEAWPEPRSENEAGCSITVSIQLQRAIKAYNEAARDARTKISNEVARKATV